MGWFKTVREELEDIQFNIRKNETNIEGIWKEIKRLDGKISVMESERSIQTDTKGKEHDFVFDFQNADVLSVERNKNETVITVRDSKGEFEFLKYDCTIENHLTVLNEFKEHLKKKCNTPAITPEILAKKFMGWKVPDGLVSDECMCFEPSFNRFGTNIMCESDAIEMFKYLLEKVEK